MSASEIREMGSSQLDDGVYGPRPTDFEFNYQTKTKTKTKTKTNASVGVDAKENASVVDLSEDVFVFGVGEKKTPPAFRNACDDFIQTEVLKTSDDEKVTEKKTTKKKENLI